MGIPTSSAAAGVAVTADSSYTVKTLAAEVRERTGINVARCYQCGKCSAGCPMTSEMAMRPHNVMYQVIRNEREQVLGSDGIWLCVTCSTCSARCPNAVDPARIIETLREMAMAADPTLAPRAISVFNKSFLDQVRAGGRMFEMGLAAQYNLRTGHLMQDATAMPALLRRGKLSVTRSNIKDTSEIRRLFDNVESARRAKSKGGRA
jgi:heterodisulfide reductase subunit C2